jgi:hypothetical protein
MIGGASLGIAHRDAVGFSSAKAAIARGHLLTRAIVFFLGSECIGAMLAGWETIVGVEREAEYAEIARARLQYHTSDRV